MRRAVVLRTAVTGAALLSMTFVGGCSSGGAGAQGPTSRAGATSSSPASASATTSPTSASPTNSGIVPPSDASTGPGSGGGDEVAGAPGVPEPARHHTKDGAIAFAKHYVDVVNETGIHPKTGVLEPLALESCKSCNNFENTVRSYVRHGQRLSGPTLVIVDSHAVGDASDKTIKNGVEVICDQPAVTVYGESSSPMAGLPRGGLVFSLVWQIGGWRVAGIFNDKAYAS